SRRIKFIGQFVLLASSFASVKREADKQDPEFAVPTK
ncbi:MAG: hypothetical protein ACI9HK_003173, partial [Pirellulaceae bacterium]